MVRRHLSMASFKRAQSRMRGRTRSARTRDLKRTKRVTTNLSRWLKRPGYYDIRGIDTRRKRRRTRRSRR